MVPILNDMQQYLVQEFVADYKQGHLSRREMLKRVLHITGSIAGTATLLLSLGCQPPQAAATPTPTAGAGPQSTATGAPAGPTAAPGPAADQPTAGAARSKYAVAADDPNLTVADVTFAGDNATLSAYLARPQGDGPWPAVLVCHENRGLVEHIRDVARRLAKAGYVALALDLLSREGGTAKVDPAEVPAKLSANPAQAVADFQAAFRYLQAQPFVRRDSIGMVGFCFGGGITWRTATAIPELRAAVPFYGPPPPLEDVPKIRAAVLAIYGGEDQRINASIPAIEAAMQQNGKTFEKVIYPGAGHAFHNDTGPNYNQQAAYDAWERTLAWFKQYLT